MAQRYTSSDSSAYWQRKRDEDSISSRISSASASGSGKQTTTTPSALNALLNGGAGQHQSAPSGYTTLPATRQPVIATTLPVIKQPVIATTLPSIRNGSGSAAWMQDNGLGALDRRSSIPSNRRGSYITLEIPKSKKRELMEQELSKIRSTRGATVRQRSELSRRQKNVIHQLQKLDASEGKAPRSYADESGPDQTKAAVTKKAVVPGSGEPKVYADAREEYSEYARQARTPSVEEYQQMIKAGATITYDQYVHRKLNAQVKSYEQFSRERAMGKPEVQTYGGVTVEKRPDAAYYSESGSYAPANSPATEYSESLPSPKSGPFTDVGPDGPYMSAKRRQEIQERYEKNRAIEEAELGNYLDDSGHINGQARDALGKMSFGPTIDEKYSSEFVREKLHGFNKRLKTPSFGTVANAGCEAIAVYNTLHDLGKDVSLSKIIYDIERNKETLWNGWFGTKTSRVDEILEMYGVKSRVTNKPEFIDRAAREGAIKEGQIFVASGCNGPIGVLKGVHTFEIVYSPSQNPQEPWLVYNRFSADEEPKPYATFAEIFDGRVEQISKIEGMQKDE